MKLTETPQFAQGKNVEAFLDDYFRYMGWIIRQTTPHEERVLRLGDRRFIKDGEALWVEYKSGLQTHFTKNVFLETISVDSANKPGWVYTCAADRILYACVLDQVILSFVPQRLREQIDDLKKMFKEVKTKNHQNATYDTWGVIVPLDYAMSLAHKVIYL